MLGISQIQAIGSLICFDPRNAAGLILGRLQDAIDLIQSPPRDAIDTTVVLLKAALPILSATIQVLQPQAFVAMQALCAGAGTAADVLAPFCKAAANLCKNRNKRRWLPEFSTLELPAISFDLDMFKLHQRQAPNVCSLAYVLTSMRARFSDVTRILRFCEYDQTGRHPCWYLRCDDLLDKRE
jgi:hypothetical protein